MLRLLHVSDLHFGRHSVRAQVEGVERLIAEEKFNAIVISGDLTQRTRAREYAHARAFVEHADGHAPVMVVPGNHDTAWWTAPMGIGSVKAMHSRYRRYIAADLEPVMRIQGATIVGLNSAHGVRLFTMTARPRDISVVGALRPEQWDAAQALFAAAPAGDLKILVFHHNLLRGEISNRWGLSSRSRGITKAAATGADLVLCGHDHQVDVEGLNMNGRRMVVACASTLTTRVRGGGPGSINVIEVEDKTMQVNVMQWHPESKTFERMVWSRFTR